MLRKSTGALAALTLVLPGMRVEAAGLWLYEMGTPDVGTASAGMASRATDGATAFANPAGMTRLSESQLMVGLQPMYSNIKFDTEEASFGGGDGGNAGGFAPTGGVFYVHSLSNKLKLGFTAGSYLGLGVQFEDDWAGRYYVQKEEFLTAFANGAVGYRVNEWLSIGGGVSLVYGELEAETAINNRLDGGADGRMKLKADDTDFGWNAGLLVEPAAGTRVGLTFISEVDLEYKDKPSFKGAGPLLNTALQLSGIGNAQTTFDFTLPDQLMLSGYHDLTPDLALMADLGWQNWSQFGEIGLSLDTTTVTGTAISRSTTADANFQDTWHTAVGARYRLDPRWSVSAGIAYDSSPVRNSDRSIVLPLDRQYRYALGVQYELRKDLTLGAAYEYMDAGSAPVDQTGGALKGDLEGDLKDDVFHILALSANWKF
ncbi:MAG: outer membrane protein transport protein [Gammaproteobacteria bacterium]|jgi:long-chain fatty acid transport protein